MDDIITFYNNHHGGKKSFYFEYDGLQEVVYFASAISVKQYHECGRMVFWECSVELACENQVQAYPTPSETDLFPLSFVKTATLSVNWNTNTITKGATARQETQIEPTMKLAGTVRGDYKDRKKLLDLYNSHAAMPLIVIYNGKETKVRFSDNLEITDYRENGSIVAFESEVELDIVKAVEYPKRERMSLREWANQYFSKDIPITQDMVNKLEAYDITDCFGAFQHCPDLLIPELHTSNCSDFRFMFCFSNVSHIRYIDLSKTTDASDVFNCRSLSRLDMDVIEMPLCTNCNSMFMDSSFSIVPKILAPVKSASYMFSGTGKLKRFPTMDYSGIENAHSMFDYSGIEGKIDIDLSSVSNMDYLFTNCSNITNINISNMGKNNSLHKFSMLASFAQCLSLKTLIGLDLTYAANTDVIFSNNMTIDQLSIIDNGTDFAARYDKMFGGAVIHHLIVKDYQDKIVYERKS